MVSPGARKYIFVLPVFNSGAKKYILVLPVLILSTEMYTFVLPVQQKLSEMIDSSEFMQIIDYWLFQSSY